MALERLQALAAARVPDLDRPVVRRRRQPCRVVREGDRRDPIAMALERLQALAAARIPDLDGLVALTPTRASAESCEKATELTLLAMALERLQARAAACIPDLDRLVV